jgi:hypothetical protein
MGDGAGRPGQDQGDVAGGAAQLQGIQHEPGEVEAGVGGAAPDPQVPGDGAVEGDLAARPRAEQAAGIAKPGHAGVVEGDGATVDAHAWRWGWEVGAVQVGHGGVAADGEVGGAGLDEQAAAGRLAEGGGQLVLAMAGVVVVVHAGGS